MATYSTGQQIYLVKAKVYDGYGSSAKKTNIVTGYYYIYNSSKKNSRIAICKKESYAKKTPVSTYRYGWVAVADVLSGQAKKNAAEVKKNAAAAKAAETAKKSTTKKTTKKDTSSIGCLGGVTFIVKSVTRSSSDHRVGANILTPSTFTMTESVNIQEHERHMKAPIPEFTGKNLSQITMTVKLSYNLGQNPMTVYNKWKTAMNGGKILALTLGSKTYGSGWLITSLTFTGEQTTGRGDWIEATVQLDLTSAT